MKTKPNTEHPSPNIDPNLLAAHVEYAAWARRKVLGMLDALQEDELTKTVTSSFPSIFATMVHVYRADRYYFDKMRSDEEAKRPEPPESYGALKQAWSELWDEMLPWAGTHLVERKDVVLEGWAKWPCWMALMQMVSHGTYHLGQVTTLIRQAGHAPTPDDMSDLIFFYLDRFPQEDQKPWKETFGMSI